MARGGKGKRGERPGGAPPPTDAVSADARGDALRWLPAVTIVALAWLTLFPIISVDAPYHLATGKRILDDRALPDRGVGSATFGDEPWHDQEWGFQVIAALIGRAERDDAGVWTLTRGGLVGLILLRALALAATLALLSAQMARMRLTPLTRSLALALTAFLTFGNLFWTVRPQVFSYLGLAALTYLLQRDRDGDRWARWAALPVIAVWANIHGAFIIGIALLGAEVAGDLVEWLWLRRNEALARAKRLIPVALLAPLAACVNPHGYHQILHPFLYVLRPEIHAGNVEWTRPDFFHLPLLNLTLLALVVAFVAHGRPRPADVLRCLMFSVLLLSAVRHLPLEAIVVVPVLAASLAAASARGGWRTNLEPTGPRFGGLAARLGAWAVLLAVVVGLSGAFARPEPSRFVTLWPQFELRTSRPMPEKGVRILTRAGIPGTILNSYRMGGFLMFRLYPEDRVFMDGRNDLYGMFRENVYNKIVGTLPGWREELDAAVARYGIEAALLDESLPLAGELVGAPGWIAPSGPGAVTDGTPGENGVVLLVRDTVENRRRLDTAAGQQ